MNRSWLVFLFFLAALSGFAQAPSALEGTITAVLMDHIQIKSDDGTIHLVVLPAGVSVTKRLTVTWSDIHAGDWVGVDSKPGADGTQESVAINIFSPSIIAKVRKGQFTMASGDLMTNAAVDQVTKGAGGASLVLKNDDAMVAVKITDQTTVHRLVDAAAADLKPGLKVGVRGTVNADASLQAANVLIAGT